jgi:hypothetical protein
MNVTRNRLFTGADDMVFFRKNFNEMSEAKRHRLTHEMTEAFYRGDVSLAQHLEDRGATFTDEMLEAAIRQQCEQLVDMCLNGGVKPGLRQIDTALKSKSLTIAEALAEHLDAHQQKEAQEKISALRTEKLRPRASTAPVVYY